MRSPLPYAGVLLVLATACPSEEAPPPDRDAREPCAARAPEKNLYFGDLHVHTRNSFDAWVFDVRTSPRDAYRFARGEPVEIPAGPGATRSVKLDRPLDFVAVTDHAEYLGEVDLCTTEGSEAYEARTCREYRAQENDIVQDFGIKLTEDPPSRFGDVCGPGRGTRCTDAARGVWARIQDAAEEAYDRTSACAFTSFVAYEYTAVTGVSNLHRNVIFRGRSVPSFAVSYFEFEKPSELFDALERTCIDAGIGCDVISIPHNSNWSNGNLFYVDPAGTAEDAARRRDLEPLIEIFQHKGDMECMNGLSGVIGAPDELCDFEKLRRPADVVDCGDETGFGGVAGLGCLSRVDFLRGILLAGLKEEARIGINPYRLGVVASTDTHNGTPGLVDETDYPGHWGANEDTPEERLGDGALTPGGVLFNGGGLTAIWAEENSRGALFDAMKRREVYGTSGPRIALRFFGGWSYPESLCADAALVTKGYAAGVPMGGDLPARTSDAPVFVISSAMDPGSAERPGTPLERLQIVKGWLAADGAHVEVADVVIANPLGTVEPSTCATDGAGAPTLCAVWRDPSFDPSQPAFYYVRAVESPTCRWSTHECLRLPAAERPAACTDPAVPKTVRERAWSSPIWYSP